MAKIRIDREALLRDAAAYLSAEAASRRRTLLAPVSIFVTELTPLEAIVKYLREEQGMRLVAIAAVLGRDQREVGVAYRRSRAKMPRPLPAKPARLSFPVALLADRRLSPFEHLVRALREMDLSNVEIARLVRRDERTVWTVARRAERKLSPRA